MIPNLFPNIKNKFTDIQIPAYRQTNFDRLKEIHDSVRKNELILAALSKAFVPLSIAAERENLFSYHIFVAEYKNWMVGFAAFTEDEIAWLYVDINYSHKGIGKALVAFALQMVKDDVSIEVLVGNTPVIGLYTSCGFQVVDTLSGTMPGNENFYVTVPVMKRNLRNISMGRFIFFICILVYLDNHLPDISKIKEETDCSRFLLKNPYIIQQPIFSRSTKVSL